MIKFSEWLKTKQIDECDGRPSKPRKMKKAKDKCVIPKGVRCSGEDLSSDY